MKKFFLLTIASMVTVFAMAIGDNSGSTKANAIDFDWDKGVEHLGGTKWYRVDLAPLYEEDNPSLTLYLTNPSNAVGTSVDVSMQATVAGQQESKDYTIAARQYKTYTANASMLVRMKQHEIYLTLTSNGRIKLSAKVFEAADLDETCKDARTLSWNTPAVQNPSYSAWWRVSLKPIKDVTTIDGFDAKVTITNTGSKTVNLKVGQSLDCPSSGLTKRNYELAPGESVIDTIPRSMINSVQPDEVYFGIENVESQITIKVEKVAQPTHAIIPTSDKLAEAGIENEFNLHVTDTIVIPAGKNLYRVSVADMDSISKYEPEFTYRNEGSETAKMTIKMAFERPAFGTSNTDYTLLPGEEEIVVYKKNMLEGMNNVDSIYLLTITDQPINFYGRYKHVREGKACKTNIDFNWETGHIQEARTTQWYAIDVAEARDNLKDIVIHLYNQGSAAATVKASVAFSCPYIDLQEITRTIEANGKEVTRRIGFSTYAMMTDKIYIGLETSQDLKFWATTADAETKAEADTMCSQAKEFNWKEGVKQNANDTVWYLINMDSVRELSAKFPTVIVQNLSSTNAAKITAELSVECPDSIENEKRSTTIAANGTYTKKLSRDLFENIQSPEIYLKVISTQAISLQVMLTEKPAGSDCESALAFNWTAGNKQNANTNTWYVVDLHDAITAKEDVRFKIENREGKESEVRWQVSYVCPDEEAPSVQKLTLAAKQTAEIYNQYAELRELPDSMMYIGVQGTTSLLITAERVAPAPFDSISVEGLEMDTISLQEDVYTIQAKDTAWEVVTSEEVLEIRDMIQYTAKTPELTFKNTSDAEVEVTLEFAYEFPIVEAMRSIKVSVPANDTKIRRLDWKAFKQAINGHNEVYVRITIPAEAAGKISYKSKLVNPFDGATKEEAIPIEIGGTYSQAPMTDRWYKINTSDLKKDKDLYNKVLNISSKNAGKGNAEINLKVNEGWKDEDLLFEALTERSRTIKKGQGKSHNIPAQVVYGLGDVVFYIWVRTTDSLVFSTKFNGTYPSIPEEKIDTTQFQAKMIVPNVWYELPADTTVWFFACAEYLNKNYRYVNSATIEYELEGNEPATIQTTGTFQDTMTYKMPVRKRTLNKSGKERHGQKRIIDLIDKALQRYLDMGLPQVDSMEGKIDTMLHTYITNEHRAGYIRVNCSRKVRLRLNMPQKTGETCINNMEFDWEHGNVNPAGNETWYLVEIDKDRLPEDKDLRLHVENWSAGESKATASIKTGCDSVPLVDVTKTLKPYEHKFQDIGREIIGTGYPNLLIEYQSDSTTHIWVEIIEKRERKKVYDTITVYSCDQTNYKDTLVIPAENHFIDSTDPASLTWRDSIEFRNDSAMAMWDSLITVNVKIKQDPIVYDIASAVDSLPYIKRNELISIANTEKWLQKRWEAEKHDSIKSINGIRWEVTFDGKNFAAIPSTPISSEVLAIRYRIVTGCEDDTLTSKPWAHAAKEDVTIDDACGPIKWNGKDYTESGDDCIEHLIPEQVINHIPGMDSTVCLHLTITPIEMPTDVVSDCKAYTWAVNEKKYTATAKDTVRIVNGDGCYEIHTLDYTRTPNTADPEVVEDCNSYTWPVNGETYYNTITKSVTKEDAEGCMTVYTLQFTKLEPQTGDTTATACDSFVWYGKTLTASTETETHIFPGAASNGCDSIVTLHLTINHSESTVVSEPIKACDSYDWTFGKQTITESGTYTYTGTTVAGCDSTVTITVVINKSATSEFTEEPACDSLYWAFADQWIKASGDYTFVGTTVAGCDSTVTLHATINKSAKTEFTAGPVCNSYYWDFADMVITASGDYTFTGKTIAGCDSTVTVHATINNPQVDILPAVAKYNKRLLVIDRNKINLMSGWEGVLEDSVSQNDLVTWFELKGATPDITADDSVGCGYYYHKADLKPLTGKYYAYIKVPAKSTGDCPTIGTTVILDCTPAASVAPALQPSLARPGEDIRIMNLDPEEETTIRVYTTEGLLQGTYTASGEETFTIKAANDHGFYLVEISNDSQNSTLRYIVK